MTSNYNVNADTWTKAAGAWKGELPKAVSVQDAQEAVLPGNKDHNNSQQFVKPTQKGGKRRRRKSRKHKKSHTKRKSKKHHKSRKGGRRRRRSTRKRKKVPWAGWHKQAPFGAARTRMFKKCGKKCFLGTKTKGDKQHPSFPICTKGTCKINSKGLYAAYIRAKEWGNPRKSYKGKGHPRYKRGTYKKIAAKAKRMLKQRGFHVGK